VAGAPAPADDVASARDVLIASTFDTLSELPVPVAGETGAAAVPKSSPVADKIEVAKTEAPNPLPATIHRSAAAQAIDTAATGGEAGTETTLGYAPPAVASEVDTGSVRVGDSAINVRAGPSSSAERLFVLEAGADISVSERSGGGWVLLADDQGREGWADSSNLANVDLTVLPVRAQATATAEAPQEEPAATTMATTAGSETRTVAGAGVNVRSSPSKDGEKLFALAGGKQVTVTENQHGWLRILDAEGRSGWVYSSFLSQ
jgi:SH3-like domain-containing protein